MAAWAANARPFAMASITGTNHCIDAYYLIMVVVRRFSVNNIM